MQTRKQIHDLFSGTGARRLPLTEILPMKNTPQEVFQKFHAFGTPGFVLESDEPDAFAYIGVRFEKRVTLKRNVLTIEDDVLSETTSTIVSDPKKALERLLLDHKTPALYPYFCGGLEPGNARARRPRPRRHVSAGRHEPAGKRATRRRAAHAGFAA